jgi:hypothetical protein
VRQPEDKLEDFHGVYAFDAAFDEAYPWGKADA